MADLYAARDEYFVKASALEELVAGVRAFPRSTCTFSYDLGVEEPLHGATLDEKLERITEMLRSIADDEPATRRRLTRIRASPEYQEAFDTADPLVSIVIPTYRSVEPLRSVALPSALAQTHRNIEVVVVGDAAPPETAEIVERCGDSRVRFENLPVRGPYPEDSDRAWLVAGSAPYNAGVAQARGMWIAPLADDDAFTPEHVEHLLSAAVDRRLELVYSPLRAHLSDGTEAMVGEFPPRLGEFGLQSAIYHAGLSFMELNLSDEIFDVPNDWSLCRRMLRAGVRLGMVDEPTVDYYPSWAWGRRPEPMKRRKAEQADPARIDAESSRAQDAEEGLAVARRRVDDLQRQLAVITSSKSWRLTGPLRAVGSQVRGWTSR